MTSHLDRETLIDYLHGALEPETDAAVFVHLEACGSCRALREEEADLGEALRRAARTEELELPSLVRARVWDAVRRERPSLAMRVLTGWGPRLAVPVAAALALGVYLGVPAIRSGSISNAPGIAASYFLDEHNAEAQTNPLGPGIAPTVYGPEASTTPSSAAAGYIDTADAATLDDADGVAR
ncbi:MAG TPA: zf-HC2 domain-containing protein [Candidatus Limnocylindria bacterium]|jgi:predicted anti-sigma-YlaC factor YlaD|nr:zf-HC2 domain-containing protein [Candidatus Limnocylindria bacterium]